MNDLKPLVSVCMITYNHESYISQAIEGILAQKTDFHFVLVIGEDCSTDNTRKICQEYKEKYPNKICLLLPKRNLGMQLNFIDTLKASIGKYIAICEGDDYWTDSYKLQKQIDLLEAEEQDGIVAVATNCSVSDLNGNVVKKESLVIPPVNEEGVYTLHDFFKNSHQYPTLTVVFRNRDMNFILENMKKLSNPFLGDWILWILLYQQGSFYFMNQVTASYRINPNSVTHTVNAIKRWEADFDIRRKLVEILPSEYHQYLKGNFNTYFKISMAYRKDKQTFMFCKYQIKSFFSSPLNYVDRVIKIIFKSA